MARTGASSTLAGMAAKTDVFDLGRLRLAPGEGRRLELAVPLGEFGYGGQRYAAAPARADAVLDVSRMTSGGFSLRLRFEAALAGPCMRCLEDAAPATGVDAREVDQPGGGEDLTSPYVHGDDLDLAAWAHDAFALALPDQLLCRPDCAGLCPECGENLNAAGPGHRHDRAPDPRWAKLRELRLE
jgi:uncharacterized protein